MLDTIFDRPIGDIGNPKTFSYPVEYKVVKNATIERVVKMEDTALIEPFIHSAAFLEEQGVKVITTSCGFLSLFHREIQDRLKVPFLSSSLMQIPFAHMLTRGKIGILTARKASLTRKHLEGVNAHHVQVVIEGMDDMPSFTRAIVDETEVLDMEKVSLEMKKAVMELISTHPEITAIVLECTNMGPYISAIREITDLPVFDITTLVNFVMRAL